MSLDDMFGISEVKPKNGKPYWLLRIKYSNRKASINRSKVYDDTIPGDREKVLKLVKQMRTDVIAKYEARGETITYNPHCIRPLSINRSGINGVTLAFRPSKTGKGGSYAFKAQWVGRDNKSYTSTFSVKKHGWYYGFVYAIRARRDADLDIYDETVIPEIGFIDIDTVLAELIVAYSDVYPQLQHDYLRG